MDPDAPDPKFDAMTARLLRREALRRAAEELNTTSGPGLEDMLARISAEVTAEATGVRVANENRAQAHVKSTSEPSSGPATDPHGA